MHSHTYIRTYVGTHKQIYVYVQTHTTHNTVFSLTSSMPLLVHTSSSSFTVHLPPSRRDWTSCNLPFPAATRRSLSSEALAAACACDDRSRTHSRRNGGSYSLFTAYNTKLIQRWVYMQSSRNGEARYAQSKYTLVHIKSSVYIPMYLHP